MTIGNNWFSVGGWVGLKRGHFVPSHSNFLPSGKKDDLAAMPSSRPFSVFFLHVEGNLF